MRRTLRRTRHVLGTGHGERERSAGQKTCATYQQPPRPAERERVKSAGDERVGVLRADLSAGSPSGWGWAGSSEDGRDIGDASRVEVDADISGEGWSGSGDDAWLSLLCEEGGFVVIKVIVGRAVDGGRQYIMELCSDGGKRG